MTMRCSIFFLIFFVLSPLQNILAQGSNAPFDAIDRDRVYDVCRVLASDKFGGRLTGDSGYTKAAQWALELMKANGAIPYDASAGYLQPFPAPYTIVRSASMAMKIGTTKNLSLSPGKDFLPLLYTDSGTITGDMVFVGWGISAPSLGYDDYAGIDVRGKIVLCFRGVPNREDSAFQHFDEHRTRMKTAKDKGALALFYIYETPIANPNGDFISNFHPAIISFDVANKLLSASNWTASALQDSLSQSRTTRSFPLDASVTYSVQADNHLDGIGYNILGILEGSDPDLKKEYVIVGGHFDHCGTHLGLMFRGASDNASGSAVVLEIMQALANHPRSKRSILFALFGGEEMGLLGSTYLADHLPPGVTKVAAMLNFDMVGTGDGAWCGYSSTPGWMKTVLDDADKKVGIMRGASPMGRVGVRSSDFAPFYMKGIPTYSFSSNGPHLFYHEAGDKIYRINPDMLADMATVGLLITAEIANKQSFENIPQERK
jgi:hypothetical protein